MRSIPATPMVPICAQIAPGASAASMPWSGAIEMTASVSVTIVTTTGARPRRRRRISATSAPSSARSWVAADQRFQTIVGMPALNTTGRHPAAHRADAEHGDRLLPTRPHADWSAPDGLVVCLFLLCCWCRAYAAACVPGTWPAPPVSCSARRPCGRGPRPMTSSATATPICAMATWAAKTTCNARPGPAVARPIACSGGLLAVIPPDPSAPNRTVLDGASGQGVEADECAGQVEDPEQDNRAPLVADLQPPVADQPRQRPSPTYRWRPSRWLGSMPRRSTSRWYLEPGLPRSVGFGPVRQPPVWRARSSCPGWPETSRAGPGGRAGPAARGGAAATRRRAASRAAAASR